MIKKVPMLLLTICLILISVFPVSANSKPQPTKALWVWDFYESAAHSEKITQLLNFLQEHKINLLFIGTKGTLLDQPSTYEELIQRAHKQGIRVFALVGRAEWALEEQHREALTELNNVLSFNKSYPSTKFDGIQYDIEPHILPEFKKKRGSVSYQFIQILKKIAKEIAESGEDLEFNAAIPCWYATGDSKVTVETGGQKKPLSYFVLDIVDTVTIMAYRDTAERQIRASQAEVDYAAKLGKKIYIGAETSPPNGYTIPDEITYYNKGLDYMNKELNTVMKYYANHKGVSGIAIHNYPTFKQMAQDSKK